MVVSNMLPIAKDEHPYHDYVPKHMEIPNPDGSRHTNRQFYVDSPLEECVELMYSLICEADADVVVIHGGPARGVLRKRLGLEKDSLGVGQDYKIMDVVIAIGVKMVSVR